MHINEDEFYHPSSNKKVFMGWMVEEVGFVAGLYDLGKGIKFRAPFYFKGDHEIISDQHFLWFEGKLGEIVKALLSNDKFNQEMSLKCGTPSQTGQAYIWIKPKEKTTSLPKQILLSAQGIDGVQSDVKTKLIGQILKETGEKIYEVICGAKEWTSFLMEWVQEKPPSEPSELTPQDNRLYYPQLSKNTLVDVVISTKYPESTQEQPMPTYVSSDKDSDKIKFRYLDIPERTDSRAEIFPLNMLGYLIMVCYMSNILEGKRGSWKELSVQKMENGNYLYQEIRQILTEQWYSGDSNEELRDHIRQVISRLGEHHLRKSLSHTAGNL